MFTKPLPRYLDKAEHYDAMRAALTKLVGGKFSDEVEKIAKDALSAETRAKDSNLTFGEFLAGVEAAGWPIDDEDVWIGYWSGGFTADEAIREEGDAGDHEPDADA